MTGYARRKQGRLPRHEARVQNRTAALREDLEDAQTDLERVAAAYDFFRSALKRTKVPGAAEQAANTVVDLLTDAGSQLLVVGPTARIRH